MIGTFISPTFAQQFKEPNYKIRGGEVLGFEIDPDTKSIMISLDQRARGELTITLPRNLIDAIIGSDAVIIITGHKEFEELNLETFSNSRNKPILVDCTGKINPKDAKSRGIIFRGIGRGDYI